MWRVVVVCGGILIAGCGTMSTPQVKGQSTAPDAALGPVWQWEATDAPTDACVVPTPERYTLQFLGDGKAQARFDCNRGSGTYAISDGHLSFGPFMSTRRACSPDSMDGRYMKELQQVVAFYVESDTLFLALSDDTGTMRFRREDLQGRQE